MQKALRLLVYDATQLDRKPAGLGLAWYAGSYLYRGLGRLDAAFGARSFESALDCARTLGARTPQLRAATRLARLRRSGGRTTDADVLRGIYATFTEGLDAAPLAEARAVLDEEDARVG